MQFHFTKSFSFLVLFLTIYSLMFLLSIMMLPILKTTDHHHHLSAHLITKPIEHQDTNAPDLVHLHLLVEAELTLRIQNVLDMSDQMKDLIKLSPKLQKQILIGTIQTLLQKRIQTSKSMKKVISQENNRKCTFFIPKSCILIFIFK